MEIRFSEVGTSLGTRKVGKEIRELVRSSICLEEKIVFDFDAVTVVSNSFADECFGKLVDEIGLDIVKSKTTFTNTNHLVSMVIRKAIFDRMSDKKLCCI